MKSYRALLVFLLMLLLNCVLAQEKILPYPIHQNRLVNDLNIVTVEFDSPGIAALYIVVRVGSRNEVEKGVTGFAHFFEHMMFRGTEKYSKDEYNAILKSTGASANAYTSLDRTVYHITGNAQKLDKLFELESDRFMNLKYSEQDFKVEAGAIKGEYTKNYASPYARIYEKIQDTAFDVHTYKHTTMGFFKDVVDMPNQYDYSLKFFDRFYRPEYTTVIVVGDIKTDSVVELAKKYFGEWKKGDYVTEIPEEPVQTKTKFTHLQNDEIPPFFSLNYKSPAFSDIQIDMPALDVLSSIIFSNTSDLYKKLVLNERKVRSLDGAASNTRDPNLFEIDVSMVKKEDMQYVKDEIVKTIESVKKDGVDEEILTKTKSNLKYSFAMRVDNPDRIADYLSRYVSLTGDPESLNRLYALYEKVTNDDIKMVANKYFVDSGLTIATITEDAKGGLK